MTADYDVGYGKPPKNGQFKKGQSGNPKGRPKGTNNIKTDILEELSEKLVVKEGGKAKKISKQRAMIKAMMAKAVHGDAKAAGTILTMLLKLAPEQASPIEEAALTPADVQILADFEAEVLKVHESEKAKTDGK